ncbi:MAG: hypothetical protein ABSG68_26670 [Thermoguttaceae bacterium]|jgi:hypothetical protein
MAPQCCQNPLESFSVEDWVTVGQDGVFTECRLLDFTLKETFECNWSRPAQGEAVQISQVYEADQDILAGRVEMFDSLKAMLASLTFLPR